MNPIWVVALNMIQIKTNKNDWRYSLDRILKSNDYEN